MLEVKKSLKNVKFYKTDLFFQDSFLKLDSNENNFGPSPKVFEALRKVGAQEIQFYPYYGKLIEKIAAHHNICADSILLTSGADEAIDVIYKTYLEEKDEVLSFVPTFSMPKIYIESQRALFKGVQYKEKGVFDPAFLMSFENEKTKFYHITSPNNPTGTITKRQDLISILNTKKGVLLDETYVNYSNESYFDLIKKYDNLFITRSFSKDFALAGLRIGYIISNPLNILELKKSISPYSVSSLAVLAAYHSLDDVERFNLIKTEIEKSKQILSSGLEKLGATVYPSSTNFILVDFALCAEFVYRKLLKNNIKVKFYKNDPFLENHLRITLYDTKSAELILEVLKPGNMVVFDMDGVLINVETSYREAISKTYEHFSKKPLEKERISKAKAKGGLNCDWDLTQYLLGVDGFNIELPQIIEVFQDIYYKDGLGLINNETALIKNETLEKLYKNNDLAIFTGRPKQEAIHTLEKFDILKYFYPVITMDDLPMNRQKPDSLGLEVIKDSVLADSFYYLGDTPDDIKCAKRGKAKAIGVLPPGDKSVNLVEKMKQEGASEIIDSVNDILEKLNAQNTFS